MLIERVTYTVGGKTRRVEFINGPAAGQYHNSTTDLRVGDMINVYAAGFGCHVYEVVDLSEAVHRGVRVVEPWYTENHLEQS